GLVPSLRSFHGLHANQPDPAQRPAQARDVLGEQVRLSAGSAVAAGGLMLSRENRASKEASKPLRRHSAISAAGDSPATSVRRASIASRSSRSSVSASSGPSKAANSGVKPVSW